MIGSRTASALRELTTQIGEDDLASGAGFISHQN